MVNQGVTPPNFATPVGQFRALLGDTDAIELVPPVEGQGEYTWFSDAEVSAFLGLYADNPKRAAARALMTIAGSQALLLKKWSSDDLSVDGAAIAEALRKQAQGLIDEENKADAFTDIFAISKPGGSRGAVVPEGTLPAVGARVKWGRIATPGTATSVDPGTGPEWIPDPDNPGYLMQAGS